MLNAFKRTKRSAAEALALVGGRVDEALLKRNECGALHELREGRVE